MNPGQSHPATGQLEHSEPFLHLQQSGKNWRKSGRPEAYLGRRAPDGSPDLWREAFAEWRWDGRRLTVRVDRYGFYPLFYFVRRKEIALSPSIARLIELGASKELDDQGIAVFLRMGDFVGEDTPFRAIRALPPGATLIWDGGEPRLSKGRPPWSSLVQINRDEAIDRFIALFRQAMERRLDGGGSLVLPLSGGRDSRHIFLELVRAGTVLDLCVTMRWFPPRPDTDAPVAAELARRIGVRHAVIEQPPSRLGAELRKNRITGFSTFEGADLLAVAEFLRGRTETHYDGLVGDVLTQPKYLDETVLSMFGEGRFHELAEGYLSPALDRFAGTVLPGVLVRRFSREAALERLVRELRRYSDLGNPHAAFRFYNRARRNVALSPLRVFGGVPHVVCPFLDHDVFDFLSSLPGPMLLGRSFHTEAIQRAFPKYADLPFARYGDRPVDDRAHFRRFAREIGQYAWTLRSTPLVRRTALVPRLLRTLIDGPWSGAVSWFGPPAVLLLQLGELLGTTLD